MTTSDTIRVDAGAPRAVPAVTGVEVSDEVWILDLGRHGATIESVTGIAVSDDLSRTDCYRIRNRLEALLDERYRTGKWPQQVLDAFPDTDAADELAGLAQFFRRCHEGRRAT